MTEFTPVSAEIRAISSQPDDLFIACTSYEPRCLGAATRLSDAYHALSILVLESSEYAKLGRTPAHKGALLRSLQGKSPAEPICVPFTLDQPITFVRRVEKAIAADGPSRLESLCTVTVDISVIPRQEMLVLLRYLNGLPAMKTIRLLYTKPMTYDTEKPGGWLTKGVRSVSSIPGFGGQQSPLKTKLLVLLLGHEQERTQITWRRHQPFTTIIIAQGSDQHHAQLSDISESLKGLLLTRLDPHASEYPERLPSMAVGRTRDVLSQIREQYFARHYMVVASNGTKPQTLGTYLAAMTHPDIQITYASPAVYNYESYSEGIDTTWELFLPIQVPPTENHTSSVE